MAQVVPGYDTQYKTVTVAANDTDINAAITAEDADSWIVVSLTLSGTDVIILFTRTVAHS